MHLRYSLQGAHQSGETRHAQVAMKDMGITYQHSTPQSMGDQWWFWNCEIPSGLDMPEFLSELDADPMKMIGFGLDEETAIEIKNGEQELGQ